MDVRLGTIYSASEFIGACVGAYCSWFVSGWCRMRCRLTATMPGDVDWCRSALSSDSHDAM